MKEQFNPIWINALASVGVEIDWKRLEASLRLGAVESSMLSERRKRTQGVQWARTC